MNTARCSLCTISGWVLLIVVIFRTGINENVEQSSQWPKDGWYPPKHLWWAIMTSRSHDEIDSDDWIGDNVCTYVGISMRLGQRDPSSTTALGIGSKSTHVHWGQLQLLCNMPRLAFIPPAHRTCSIGRYRFTSVLMRRMDQFFFRVDIKSQLHKIPNEHKKSETNWGTEDHCGIHGWILTSGALAI